MPCSVKTAVYTHVGFTGLSETLVCSWNVHVGIPDIPVNICIDYSHLTHILIYTQIVYTGLLNSLLNTCIRCFSRANSSLESQSFNLECAIKYSTLVSSTKMWQIQYCTRRLYTMFCTLHYRKMKDLAYVSINSD